METSGVDKNSGILNSEFHLNAGNLASIASLHYLIAPQLAIYSHQYMAGNRPRVILNLKNIQPRKMSMSALTALLTILDRLREYSDSPIQVEVNWNPEIFSFWEDIGFFYLGRERDLFEWREGIIGGYSSGNTNPNTKLLFFEMSPDTVYDPSKLATIKDGIRNQVKEKLLILCGELFRPRRGSRAIPSTLRDQVAVTSAELVVNAQLWGRAHAFVGLQRTSKGITVSACDSGEGFHSSLQKKQKQKFAHMPSNHLESLAIGCVINNEDFGLRRAIDMVTRFGGRVDVSSYNAEIVWQGDIWSHWLEKAISLRDSANSLQRGFGEMREQFMAEKLGLNKQQVGYWREWEKPLRGSRVTFEIPIPD